MSGESICIFSCQYFCFRMNSNYKNGVFLLLKILFGIFILLHILMPIVIIAWPNSVSHLLFQNFSMFLTKTLKKQLDLTHLLLIKKLIYHSKIYPIQNHLALRMHSIVD